MLPSRQGKYSTPPKRKCNARTAVRFRAARARCVRLYAPCKAAITFLDVSAFFGISSIKRELSSALTRVADVSATVPVLVNGRMTQLRVTDAKGVLSDGQDRETFDYLMLDNPMKPDLVALDRHGNIVGDRH